MVQFLVTILAGFLVGLLLHRLKVPGGMLVGSIVGVALLSIGLNFVYVPRTAKVAAQIMAGAFIGCSVERSDLKRLRYILKPAALLLSTYIVATITMGFLIHAISPLNLSTALFSAVPGGISDIPLVAADMGADAPKVAVLQFIRLVVGIGIFPGMIARVCRDEPVAENADPDRVVSKTKETGVFLVTLGVATAFGLLGNWLRIPAGTMVFSLCSVIGLKLLWGKSYLPIWVRRIAQVLSGAYIGASVSLGDILELRYLVGPALILTLGYSAICFLGGWGLPRFCGMSRRESMLVATPAGASDMALISLDMGVQSTDLVVLQVIRLVVVTAVFPQVINLILHIAA